MTPKEKVETVDYIMSLSFKNKKPSKNQVISILGLNKSTYFAIINHKPSDSEIQRHKTMDLIYQIYHEYNGIYGSPKIHSILMNKINISLRTVSIYMKQMGLKSIVVTKRKHQKQDEQQLPFDIQMCNYIKESRPMKPHTHILTDITYIYTIKSGWTYLLTFMDMFSRKILAWDLSANMTASWVTKIAKKLINRYNTIEYIHSDRGSQYTSKVYLSLLLNNGIAPSFSANGYPYHNAWIESFHAQLKKEYIYHRNIKDVDEAKICCSYYIEGFYNTIRIQKSLGYLSPNEFEENHSKCISSSEVSAPKNIFNEFLKQQNKKITV